MAAARRGTKTEAKTGRPVAGAPGSGEVSGRQATARRGRRRDVYGGVDTHKDTHHAAVVDRNGGVLGDAQFPAEGDGYQQLLDWLHGYGRVVKVGVEGTGSYGAGLQRHLHAAGVSVVEINRPNRQARRRHGKSDPIDAVAAARAALSGQVDTTPKTGLGPVEAIRVLRIARDSAVKERTAAINQLKALVVTAADGVRAMLRVLTPAAQLRACIDFVVDEVRLHDPVEATKAALHAIATRIAALNTEVAQADKRLKALTKRVAPRLTALFGVGPDTAGQLLTTAGDNPDRLASESSLAHLCGVAPIEASSGQITRYRLNRGGDRQANKALYTIVLTRLRYDEPTQAYLQRRTQQGRTKKEIIRCLKRYVAREIYQALRADFAALTP
jgi:transposase